MPIGMPEPTRMRVVALDWMRGLVMILMSIDHASGAFNAGRVFSDSASMYQRGMALPVAQFFTRWITHLCAPSFVFLAGAAVAVSVERRLARGEPAGSVDRYLVQRGLIIAALDPLWMTWGFTLGHLLLLQVLYAIGTSLLAMALLRRLPQAWLVGIALALMLGGEAVIRGLLSLIQSGKPTLVMALPWTGGRMGKLIVAYPTLPWLAIMMLGWAFGRWLVLGRPRAPERLLFVAGGAALGVFALVRGVNAYGNMQLLREDNSLLQWLHVSKYPPGLSYYTLELGIMALLLGGLFMLARRAPAFPSSGLLLVLGQTALFFYLLHVHLLEAAAWALSRQSKLGLWSAYLGAVAIIALLYPACVRYRAYKQDHPDGWTRYL
jgi:uncharacterized membrane protein